jgi:outer membrane protein insertion porin family
VIFQVVERPLFQEVKILGNQSVNTKTLKKEAELKVGDAADPFSVENGRRKIEEFYQKKGFSKVRVTILEGNKAGDLRAIFLIDEGPQQKVLWISFVGNTTIGGQRLLQQIKTSRPWFYLIKGEVDRKQIDEDKDRLTAYYRGLGFFRAKVGADLEFNEKQDWLSLTFVIDEGPRYAIHNVMVVGNTRFTTQQLTAKLKLQGGGFFNQAQMNSDVARIQEKYGGIGYVFADVKAENKFLDEPGKLDLVYNITEGDRYRVGRINVQIKGDSPHTQITTVLNRLSLKPGDIVDLRELRDSERRLKASMLFVVDPSKGTPPKIVYSPPDSAGKDKTELARRADSQTSYYRAPDPAAVGPAGGPALPSLPPGERYADLNFMYENPEDLRRDEQGAPPPDGPVTAMEPPLVVRGQYTTDGGWGPDLERSSPAPAAAAPPAAADRYGPVAPSYSVPPAAPGYAAPPPGYAAPGPATAGPALLWSAPPGPAATGPVASPPLVPGPVAQGPAMPGAAMPGPGGGFQPLAGPCPPPVLPTPGPFQPPPVDRTFGDATPYMFPTPTGEPLRDLDLDVRQEETQTGRLMFGIGVNSDAGLIGNIVLDEQNFDWTRVPGSWEDIRNGTAFRGAGERFRLEAAPGTQVQRYMASFQEPYFFFLADKAVSLGLSGFFYDRIYTEWTESRAGGRVGLGYQFTHDLTGTVAFQGQNVNMRNLEFPGLLPPQLGYAIGDSQLYGFQFQLAHDTRDNAFLATEGHYIQASFEEVIGTYQFPRASIEAQQYFKLHEQLDFSGRHVLSLSARVGFTGDDTPIFERYYAGGFSTIRGFAFRGVTPRDAATGMGIGGDFQAVASAQYLFPITADDILRGVFFVDAGTVEPTINNWIDSVRVAPGFGLRIVIPMMGPAPIALDFAFPVVKQAGDQTQVFSFFVGINR